ncbi:conserved exported protein of unknown function [Rhodovastum atsumiense]|uniref:Outer membrane beta-barrel protein n=1 Tax=Rhodovastum atsumiense TaxID=504468 RepID=A0A5M6ISB7_9PROT|nr:hypothetical protein [Rhodovastum atsumiense]KAA5611206.1 hypothetical protein F1189_15675 [Rhodovastum atsumiense]CAH2602484.1 conserved exported protein of unknown function [Rhodovastum atsumiense]
MRMPLLLALGLACAVMPREARAQAAATPTDGWQFNLTALIWLPSISGTTTIRGINAPTNASFTEILGKSDSVFGYMGHAEAWKDRIGIFVEPIWMKLEFKSSGAIAAKNVDNLLYTEFGLLWRAREGVYGPHARPWELDLLGGGRYTYIDPSLSFALGPTFGKSREWVDPFIGGRLRADMTERMEVSLRGDVGGFGVGSQFSWNVTGLIGYRFEMFHVPSTVFAGYRAFSQYYRSGSGRSFFKWDNLLYGPVLGLQARF